MLRYMSVGFLVLVALSACGQKGPLYLPNDGQVSAEEQNNQPDSSVELVE